MAVKKKSKTEPEKKKETGMHKAARIMALVLVVAMLVSVGFYILLAVSGAF